MFSLYLTHISPSLNLFNSRAPNETSIDSAIFSAKGIFELPAKIINPVDDIRCNSINFKIGAKYNQSS